MFAKYTAILFVLFSLSAIRAEMTKKFAEQVIPQDLKKFLEDKGMGILDEEYEKTKKPSFARIRRAISMQGPDKIDIKINNKNAAVILVDTDTAVSRPVENLGYPPFTQKYLCFVYDKNDLYYTVENFNYRKDYNGTVINVNKTYQPIFTKKYIEEQEAIRAARKEAEDEETARNQKTVADWKLDTFKIYNRYRGTYNTELTELTLQRGQNGEVKLLTTSNTLKATLTCDQFAGLIDLYAEAKQDWEKLKSRKRIAFGRESENYDVLPALEAPNKSFHIDIARRYSIWFELS